MTIGLAAVVLRAGVAVAVESSAEQGRHQTLLLDAAVTQVRESGPPANEVGHVQTASGILRDAKSQPVGGFRLICRWVEKFGGDDARERCSGSGRTADGGFAVAGPARVNSREQSWTVTGTDGSYRGASGSAFVRAFGFDGRESLLLLTLVPRTGVTLRIGRVPRPQANAPFVARVNKACSHARTKTMRLPPFPVQNFDPLKPDPALLPQVGRFFSGPGDPRPILHALRRQLAGYGRPPAGAEAWTRFLSVVAAKIADFDGQVRAALAGDATAWTRATKAALDDQRKLLIAGGIFGADKCVL